GHRVEKRRILKCDSDRASDPSQVLLCGGCEIDPVHQYPAGLRPLQAYDVAQKRTFSRSAPPQQNHRLPTSNVQVDTVQYTTPSVLDDHVANGDHWFGCRSLHCLISRRLDRKWP